MTSKIYVCRVIYRKYNHDQIWDFRERCLNKKLFYVGTLDIEDNIFSVADADFWDQKDEVRLQFTLNDSINRGRHTKFVLALSELSQMIKEVEAQLRDEAKDSRLTASLTLLSRNVSPSNFELENIFYVKQITFGNVNSHNSFAPTYFWKERNINYQVFAKYLRDERSIDANDCQMVSVFEHDREAFNICFPHIEKVDFGKPDDPCLVRIIDVKIKYAAIRRLIVKLEHDDNEKVTVNFTFQLRYPAMVYIHQGYREKDEDEIKFKGGNRFLTWCGGALKDAISYSSCLNMECRDVKGRVLMDCLDRLRKNIDSPIEYRWLGWKPLRKYEDYYHKDYFTKLPPDSKYYMPFYFPLVYAIEGLISCRGELYDHFFRPKVGKPEDLFIKFLDTVTGLYEECNSHFGNDKINKVVAVLETMLQHIQSAADVPPPLPLFYELYRKNKVNLVAELTDELEKEGYMRVRKIVITPSRKLYVNPEMIMGNRSLRKKGADYMLRIIFRDEDGNKVSNLPPHLIKKTVAECLGRPIFAGMREYNYLCSSNSQLRDHGCYFLAGTKEIVENFRLRCGRFSYQSIPKVMSRMGQLFTQSRELGIEIESTAYTEICDYKGGQNGNGEPYTFSDGVGMISPEYCHQIVRDMKLGNVLPCCFQIRFRGYKGVVLINHFMSQIKEWAHRQNIKPADDVVPWYENSIIFRESQKKFHGPIEKHVEIVKISSPIPVALNKPLINILDQVSEMHGPEPHKRMCNRIHDLLQTHINTCISSLYDEAQASLTLNEFPKYILYENLRDFHRTEEPFFRSMLRSSALVSLHKLIEKMQIRIPTSEGRMAFGVVDETGLLQYGQVFFQYSVNASVKYPGPFAQKFIHTGPILITKNPSVVAGDVRMFEAVDLPCLHDLVDVLVFPQHGPRPHPDEMAGSDLDGDEYSIFWDPRLFLVKNEPAFDFTPDKSKNPPLDEEEVKQNLTKHMIDFFVKYVSQDAIGQIANAHLANSDFYGINSEHCFGIAKKHNQAVDFVKSGQTPESLRKGWSVDGQPPEFVERFPNYMGKNTAASYKSIRLLGDLYYRVYEIKEIIRIEELSEKEQVVEIDETIVLPDDDEFMDDALESFVEYSSLIENLCEDYGISKEGELFSGRFTALKKQASMREDDNMSYYNTQHMIEERLAGIFAKFRLKFFDEFGGIEKHTEYLNEQNDYRDTFRRICTQPGERLRRKASAYYRTAYTQRCHLSFPWVVSEILCYNRQQYLLHDTAKFSICPLYDALSDHINTMCQSPTFNETFQSFKISLKEENGTKLNRSIAELCECYDGFEELVFFIQRWSFRYDLKISLNQMSALLLLFGLGRLHQADGGWIDLDQKEKINLKAQMGGLGKRFWDFIRYLKTRNFGFSGGLSLSPFVDDEISRSQCEAIYYTAMDTFYAIAANRRFSCLPNNEDNVDRRIKLVTEGQTFVIEVPLSLDVEYQKLFKAVGIKCGLTNVASRKKPSRMGSKSCLISMKPVGNFASIQKFRTLLEVKPFLDEPDLQVRSEKIFHEVYSRLMFYNREDVNVDQPYEETPTNEA